MMFRGKNANRCRSLNSSTRSCLRSWLPQLQPMCYPFGWSHLIVHLGARYTMDLDIAEEIVSRIWNGETGFRGDAESHFLAIELLRQMPGSSCTTALFLPDCSMDARFGAMFRRHFSSSSRAMIIKHHRSIHNCGFWKEDGMSDDAFIATYGVMPFRLHWARHRLVYLQHVARHGLPVHLRLLHAEYATGKGWLHEVAQELTWMSTLIDLPFPASHYRGNVD